MAERGSGQQCAECGARTEAGAPTCSELRDALLARDFEQPALYFGRHRLAVDSYCVQHSSYVRSAKSLAAHLCGLCVALERDNDPALLDGLQRWLSTNPPLERPALPAFRGELTIAHVAGLDDPVAYRTAVEEWARSAWDAYAELHDVARQWLAMSAKQRQ
ncbi:MAG: DUF5946 family protein [Gemmatimonadota bacterium]